MLTQILGNATSSVLLFFLIVNPHSTLSVGEYGDMCNSNADCKSADTQNPLICFDPNEGTPTTTESVPPTTTEITEEPTTTTETITTEDPTTTTTEDPTTTTEDPTLTTEDPTLTTEDPTLTTEDLTSTTKDPTSTTEETATTKENIASEKPISDAKGSYYLDYFGDLELTSTPVCGCPLDMIRDEDLQRCVTPPFGSCDLRSGDGNYRRTCTKFAQCYPDPEDENNTSGTCYCDQDATEDTAAGICRLDYGSTKCKEHTDCDVRNLLTCQNNTCVCMYEGLQKWNPTEKKCGFVVGESCAENAPFPTSICVENAVCSNETKKCACVGDYRVTPEGECKLSYNARCNNDNDCHPNFKCSTNICTCPKEDQIYHASTGKCHIPAGSPCDASIDSCTLGAECKNEICVCQSGYLATSEHVCHALVNSKCSDEVPCHLDQYLDICNMTHPYCECVENYRYNAASDRCVGNLDETCKVDEDCIDHAICMTNGKCHCGGDYIPGENKMACYTHYGRPCSGIECYPGHFLKCSENNFTCICESIEDQIFDEEKLLCVAKVGRLCGTSANGIQCVKNSVCGVENLDTKCKCFVGYTQNNLGLCIKSEETSSGQHLKIGKAHMHFLFTICSLIILVSNAY